MIIREANQKDNQALLELSRENPMQSSLSVYVDRSPDYFYLPSLQGYNSKVLVAEREGQIVGVIGYSFRNVVLFGRPVKIGYLGGLKISKSAKGSTALFRLMRKTYEEMIEKNVQIGILFALKENQRVLKVISGRLNIPEFYPIATIKVFHIIPIFRFKGKSKYKIDKSSPSDFTQIEELFTRNFKRYELVENFGNGKLKKILRESKDFSLDNFLVAKKNGKIVAVLSYWNQMNFKKTVIQRYGGKIKKIYYFLKPFNIFPKEGEAVKVLEIRHLAYEEGHLDAVKDVIKYTFRKFYSHFKLFRIGLHEKDPLIQCLKGLPKIGTEVVLYAAFRERNDSLINKLQSSLIWEDMTLH